MEKIGSQWLIKATQGHQNRGNAKRRLTLEIQGEVLREHERQCATDPTNNKGNYNYSYLSEKSNQITIVSYHGNIEVYSARPVVPKNIYESMEEVQDAAAAREEGDKTELAEVSCWIE